MAKSLREYIKYTKNELDQYAGTEGSCVRKFNTNLHFSMGPYCLADFKNSLMSHVARTKVGFYDLHLDGIVLDVKKIKVLGTTGALRADDPKIHININADVYVFKPEEGAVLTGIVKHIGPHQVGVIMYRVFNANLKVAHRVDKTDVRMDQEVKFRIRNYNLQDVYPYIDGELLTTGADNYVPVGKNNDYKLEDYADSGIEEKYGVQDVDDLLSVIKTEAPSEYEQALEESKKQKSKKSKKSKDTSKVSTIGDIPLATAKQKSSEKRKRCSSTSSTNTDECIEVLNAPSTSKIKRELPFNDNCLVDVLKEIKKKEKNHSSKKKHKNKNVLVDQNVKIKEEF